MIPLRGLTAFWLACLAGGAPERIGAQPATSPTIEDHWKIATPEQVGIDSTPLAEMIDFAREHEIPVHSVQIVRRGQLVLDAYFHPYRAGMRHDIASVTKSITSTLIGLAIEKRHLRDVHQSVLSFFPARSIAALDARKRALTLEHLLTMQAGWDCGFEPNEARLFQMRRSSDWAQFMLDLPMIDEPGKRWAYCSGNCHLLSAIVTQTTGTNALAFARQELFMPLGIDDVVWPADSRGNNHGWGDLQLRPRDMAKLGQLFLQRGRWGNRQVISEGWILQATRAHVERTSNNDHYGYFWWVKGKDYPGMFEAVGRGGQRINVWPAKDLVLVFTGGGFEPGDLAKFILKALKSDEPLPTNPLATARLGEKVADAARRPSPGKIAELPVMARRISGKNYALSSNGLDLSALSLRFTKTPEATARLTRLGQDLHCPVGLDGVERFSTNTLIDLPFASKGRWLTEDAFLLQLDRVGGISYYNCTLTFAPSGNAVSISLKERTGLDNETFDGTALP